MRLSCSLPDYRHSLPLPPSLASVAFESASLTGVSVTGAENGCWAGWLLAGAGFVFPCCKSRVFMVYVLFVLRCFFFCSHTVLPKEHSLGFIYIYIFFSLSSCKCCIFFNSLSSCSVYPLVICMLCMYGQVDG